ncbi:hypothetical protein QBC35DRAFT_463236 [Podospora australis]|uniref:Peptidase M4 C-terminal domain-containing protein n=1 Tax=Podospora australis TaxID=1536484 RepID=A0AAN6WTM7_9PEZI|nr:hypothetical protein QBC35DRAFT_463236 [Podospora australis]
MEQNETCSPDQGSTDVLGHRCLFTPPHLVNAIAQSAISTSADSLTLAPGAIQQLQTFSTPSGNSQAESDAAYEDELRKQELLEISSQLARAAEEDPIPSEFTNPGTYRKVYNLQFTKHPSSFPGSLWRKENDPRSDDEAVNSLYDSMGVVYKFFSVAFNDNNIFRTYTPPVGIVHYDFYFPGAFFHIPYPDDGTNRHTAIICGDGWANDPWNNGASLKNFNGLFGNFAASLEVVAHEMVHGFLHAVCKLKLDKEPGVVNEHLADVFGIMCEQFSKDQTVFTADWLVGEDLIAPDWKGVAFRSFKAPGTAYRLSKEPFKVQDGDDAQVAHMDEYLKGEQDKGGVHINSGILNKAFFLVATRLAETLGEKYKYSWTLAGKIWYTAFTAELSTMKMAADCDVRTWAARTYSAAKRKLKLEKEVCEIVKGAWGDVGITVG